jgi:hypothetical protein
MFNIASIASNGNKQYLIQIDGKKMEWDTKADAEHQIACLKRTAWYEPKNFKWVIEPV